MEGGVESGVVDCLEEGRLGSESIAEIAEIAERLAALEDERGMHERWPDVPVHVMCKMYCKMYWTMYWKRV